MAVVLLAVGLLLALLVLVAAVLRSRRSEQRMDAAVAEAQREAAAWKDYAESVHAELAGELRMRLPALVDLHVRTYPGVEVPARRYAWEDGTPMRVFLDGVETLLRESAEALRADIAGSARAAVRDLMEMPQTLLVRTQHALSAEMDQHEARAVKESFLRLDRLVSMALRALQRPRVLAGSWPGLQRANAPVAEVVEAARGRIEHGHRVEFRYRAETAGFWVSGREVEPVAMTLAELLDNATSFSPYPVQVGVEEAAGGLVIRIEDRGVGMSGQVREAAAAALHQSTRIDVTRMDTFKAGFALTGRLAGDYGFRVDVSGVSRFGGVEAVVFLPAQLLATAPADGRQAEHYDPRRAADPQLTRHTAVSEAGGAKAAPAEQRTHNGLPRRRAQPAMPAEAARSAGAGLAVVDPEQAAAGLANLAQAMEAGSTGNDEGTHP
jgi:signal transduction histidine kinase